MQNGRNGCKNDGVGSAVVDGVGRVDEFNDILVDYLPGLLVVRTGDEVK